MRPAILAGWSQGQLRVRTGESRQWRSQDGSRWGWAAGDDAGGCRSCGCAAFPDPVARIVDFSTLLCYDSIRPGVRVVRTGRHTAE